MTLITESPGRKAYVRIHVETSFHPATLHEEAFVITGTEATHRASVERIPLYFRCDRDDVEYATEMVDFWPTGFLMKTREKLALGTLLLLRLHVPIEISGSPFREMRTKGRVVSQHRLEDGSVVYTVEIEQAET